MKNEDVELYLKKQKEFFELFDTLPYDVRQGFTEQVKEPTLQQLVDYLEGISFEQNFESQWK